MSLAHLWPSSDVTATLDDDEEIVDIVRRHRLVLTGPVIVVLLGLAVMLVPGWPRVADVVGLLLCGWAAWQVVQHSVDRFVITNCRVFRVWGVLRRSRASMPIQRVDITVHKPLAGLLLGYGHFVFESVDSEQGLREIRFVGDPDERERLLQRLMHPRGGSAPSAQSAHCSGCRCAERELVPVTDSPNDPTVSWSTEQLS